MKSKKILLILLVCMLQACYKNTGTSLSNNSGSSDNVSGGKGVGGSTARFTIAGDYLYTVDNQSLNVFNITDPRNPTKTKDINLGFGIETIFARDNTTLFIGTQSGMYIYDVTDPVNIRKLTFYSHIYSCDPVVADDKYAYVTLSTSSICGRSTNCLDIIDIQNLSYPYKLKTYNMTNPKGVGVSGNMLFICDNGLKVYDATDKYNIIQKQYYNTISANDVIPLGNLLLVIGNDGMYQYQVGSDFTVSLLSTIYSTQK